MVFWFHALYNNVVFYIISGEHGCTIFRVTELRSIVNNLMNLFQIVFRYTGFIFVYVFCPVAKNFKRAFNG